MNNLCELFNTIIGIMHHLVFATIKVLLTKTGQGCIKVKAI